MSREASARPAAIGEPVGFGFWRHLALAAFWFGISFHWGPILGILVPARVAELLPRETAIAASGLLFGLGAVFAVALPPVVGAWSDGIRTRWGRRRPLMLAGVALNVAGLLLMMVAPVYSLFLVGYLVVQFGNNFAGAAYSALIPDVVPADEFGRASGFLGGLYQVGSVAGILVTLVATQLHARQLTFAIIAGVVVLSLLPVLRAAEGEGVLPPAPRTRQALRTATWRFVSPMFRGDFGWVVWTRMLMTGGIWLIYPFLLFFFRDVVGVERPDEFTALWQLCVVAAAIPLGILGGWLSDRLGRKPFVYASGAAQGLVVLYFIVFYPDQAWVALLLGALYGVGYGLYYAVDWALACDTLPDRRASAKDMGLFHVAYTLPQVAVPGVAGVVLAELNRQSENSGYRVVFAGAIVLYAMGTILVSRVRSAR